MDEPLKASIMDQEHGVSGESHSTNLDETQEGTHVAHTEIVAQEHAMVIAPQIINSCIHGGISVNVSNKHNADKDSTDFKSNLKKNLRERFEKIFEGIARRGNPTLLNRVFTEVYIVEGEREVEMLPKGKQYDYLEQIWFKEGHPKIEELSDKIISFEHEVWQLDVMGTSHEPAINCNNIFKPLPGQNLTIRTVLTKGVAGIGKSVSVQKFILDWAEGKANQDVDFIFILPFRELNRYQNDILSLCELLEIFHPELKYMKDVNEYNDAKMVFIFDGLDESQLPLNFQSNKFIADLTQKSSLDELLTNLFKAHLFPSAHIWITSRPGAVHQIIPDCVDRVTEIRGFNDNQKEEYFRKRFPDKMEADRIISHIRASRSLHTMCHIPVFCWITSTVLSGTLSDTVTGNNPSTLTGMYTRFLLIQLNVKNQKYNKKAGWDSKVLSSYEIEILAKIGKLAFENLEKSNLLFSEEDLERYGLNTVEISIHSGLFTEILKKEDPMFEEQLYSFVHLSIQEYLAALYVFLSFLCGRVPQINVTGFDKTWLKDSVGCEQEAGCQALSYKDYLSYVLDDSDCDSEDEALPKAQTSGGQQLFAHTPQDFSTLHEWHRLAVDKALKSGNGHLDLFLRFFLGLSVEANYSLFRCLSLPPGIFQEDVWKTSEYIKQKLGMEDQRRCPTPERCINLLHCLTELGDTTVVGEIQSYFTSNDVPEKRLTAAQCSALAYMMLTSEKVLEEFVLRGYRTSAGGRRRLVPLVKCCKKALLANCQLTRKCFETITSVLHLAGSPLRELDLSHNFLVPETLKTLCAGLSSPHCSLDSLNISYINLEESGAMVLKAALLGFHQQPSCLRLSGCYLRDDCSEILLTALQSEQSRLTLLDLSYNRMTDAGLSKILTGLAGPNCKLQTLRLGGCPITVESCEILGTVLEHSSIRELDLSVSGVGDEGVKRIFSRTLNQLETLRLRECGLSAVACDVLGEALSSSLLKELELQDNDLRDSGVKLLCVALGKPTCILQSVGLSGCLVTEEGCIYLASALKSNPSHLQVLDLSYNHPGESGERMLSEAMEDPNYRLETLNLKDSGLRRMKTGLRKYQYELTLEPNTKTHRLHLSEDMKMAYIPRPCLFRKYYGCAHWSGLKACCSEGLTGGRFYWEVEWTESVVIGMKYKGKDSRYHKESWSLYCNSYRAHYEASHNNSFFRIDMADTTPRRVGVYLDWPAGTLSFYTAASDGLTHLHTFNSDFNKPLYPEFYLEKKRYSSIKLLPTDTI